MILVYSTALIILFGFVIMKKKKQYPYTSIFYFKSPIYFYIFPFLLFLIYLIYKEGIIYNTYEYNIKEIDLISVIGYILYKDPIYFIQIILSAILLLFPIIAIIYL